MIPRAMQGFGQGALARDQVGSGADGAAQGLHRLHRAAQARERHSAEVQPGNVAGSGSQDRLSRLQGFLIAPGAQAFSRGAKGALPLPRGP